MIRRRYYAEIDITSKEEERKGSKMQTEFLFLLWNNFISKNSILGGGNM